MRKYLGLDREDEQTELDLLLHVGQLEVTGTVVAP